MLLAGASPTPRSKLPSLSTSLWNFISILHLLVFILWACPCRITSDDRHRKPVYVRMIRRFKRSKGARRHQMTSRKEARPHPSTRDQTPLGQPPDGDDPDRGGHQYHIADAARLPIAGQLQAPTPRKTTELLLPRCRICALVVCRYQVMPFPRMPTCAYSALFQGHKRSQRSRDYDDSGSSTPSPNKRALRTAYHHQRNERKKMEQKVQLLLEQRRLRQLRELEEIALRALG